MNRLLCMTILFVLLIQAVVVADQQPIDDFAIRFDSLRTGPIMNQSTAAIMFGPISTFCFMIREVARRPAVNQDFVDAIYGKTIEHQNLFGA